MIDDLKNAREVLSAYDQLVDDLRAENARLREVLIAARERCGTELHPRIDAALNEATTLAEASRDPSTARSPSTRSSAA